MPQIPDPVLWRLPLLLSLASAAIVGTALIFEHGFGYAPCELCLYQRVPYYLGLALFLPPLLLGWRAVRPVLMLAVLLFAGGAAVAGFHVGVEQGWWQGPSTCSAGVGALPEDPEAALEAIMTAQLVRCDEIAWSLLGLSMAGWNMLLALGLAGLALAGLGRLRRTA